MRTAKYNIFLKEGRNILKFEEMAQSVPENEAISCTVVVVARGQKYALSCIPQVEIDVTQLN